MRDGIITIVAVIIAFLALDDISTDTATSFAVERGALVMCGVWFGLVSWRTRRLGRRGLRNVSLGVTVALALAQSAIGPGTVPSLQIASVVTLAGLGWFAVLAGILVRSDGRAGIQPAAGRI